MLCFLVLPSFDNGIPLSLENPVPFVCPNGLEVILENSVAVEVSSPVRDDYVAGPV